MRALGRFAYRLFGGIVHRYRPQLQPLEEALKKARIPLPVEEYVSFTLLAALLVFFLALPLSFILFHFVYVYPSPFDILSTLLVSFSAAALLFVALWMYPSIRASNRAEALDAHVTHAVLHMSTLAGTGVPPIVLFRAVSRIKEYGELAAECARIVRDVDVFGKDILTALSDAARRSPSRRWADVLWGIITTLRSGGDLRSFLMDRAKELVEEAERAEKQAMETLNLVTEIYMVVFVLAPVIGVLMIALMGLLGGVTMGMSPRMLLLFGVYFALPLIGALFLLFAESQKPKEVI